MRRIAAYVVIIAVVAGLRFTPPLTVVPPSYNTDLSVPSPALGQVIANSVHRAVTDPYFRPLEKLAGYMREKLEIKEIDIDQLTKWAPDDKFPTCFVWDIRTGSIKIDQPASPWGIEIVVEHVQEALQLDNPGGHLYINTFNVNDEKYWLGFFRIPRVPALTNQVAGVFFNIDSYLQTDVPRLIAELVEAPRFPLAAFQKSEPPIHGEEEGDISIRIIDDNDEVYYQNGRNFEPEMMIYSETKYYLNPIVCLQEGWDLQVFSSNVVISQKPVNQKKLFDGFLVAALLIISLVYWWIVRIKQTDEKGN